MKRIIAVLYGVVLACVPNTKRSIAGDTICLPHRQTFVSYHNETSLAHEKITIVEGEPELPAVYRVLYADGAVRLTIGEHGSDVCGGVR